MSEGVASGRVVLNVRAASMLMMGVHSEGCDVRDAASHSCIQATGQHIHVKLQKPADPSYFTSVALVQGDFQ